MIEFSWLSKILFLIGFILVFEALFMKRDLLSPIRIWTIIWCIVIGLAELKLSYFQKEWSLQTWVILVTSIFSYMLGAFLTHTVFLKANKKHNFQDSEQLRDKRILTIIITLSGLFLITYLIEMKASSYEIPALSSFPDEARKSFGIFGIHLFIEAYIVIAILSAIYFLKVKADKRYKLLIILILSITTPLFLLLLNRLNLFIILTVLVMLHHYLKKYISFKALSIIFASFVILFVGIQEFRSTQIKYVEKYIYVVSKMKLPEKYALISGPYMYLVMNLENLDNGVKKLEELRYGQNTFDFALAISGLKHTLADYSPPKEAYAISKSYNTFPFMWYLYWDFHIFGVMFGSLLLGSVISYFYQLMRIKKDILHILLYSYLSVIIFLSFFTAMYSRLAYVFSFVLVIVAVKFSLMKPKDERS